MMSMKRERDDDHYRSRETARRREDKGYNSSKPFDRPSHRDYSRSKSPAHRNRQDSRSKSPINRHRHNSRSRSPVHRHDSRSRSPVHRHRHNSRSRSPAYRTRHNSTSKSPVHRKRHSSSRSPHRHRSNRSPNGRQFPSRYESNGRSTTNQRPASQSNDHENHKSSPVKTSNPDLEEKPFVKERVNFNKSGKLAQDTNMHNGVIVKYSEPIEAAKPTEKWRLYPFKNDESLPFVELHRKSHYLLGRDRKVADIPLDHPSISKQHAAIQFRKVEIERKDGSKQRVVRPYLMDLESSNKTFLNNKPIDPLKYYQLLEKDCLKFGFSTREYVVLIDTTDQEG